jgi:hypothetical protein
VESGVRLRRTATLSLHVARALFLATLAGITSTVHGGELMGRVVEQASGRGVKRVTVWAHERGRSVGRSALSEGDGRYRLEGLPAGEYAVCLAMAATHRPACATLVEVPAEGAAELDLKVRVSLTIEGDSWVQPFNTFGQSFVASGLGVTTVGVKAFGGARPVEVSLHEGVMPDGRDIGPARTTPPVGGEGSAIVRWGGGELPTRPGEHYILSLAAPPGMTWVTGVAGRGDVYPVGMAWFDGVPRRHSDLGFILLEDNDGLRTSYALTGGEKHAWLAISAGQTFTALSRCITYAAASLSGVKGPPVYVRFSIHRNGPGGEQVGPSKSVVASDHSAVAWLWDEVPVEPGEMYYLHIESLGGTQFLIGIEEDAQAPGHAVLGGEPRPGLDLCTLVAGEITDADFGRLLAHPQCEQNVPVKDASFESGMRGWQRDGDVGAVVACDGGVAPAWGARMFGWTHDGEGEGSRTILYQTVPAEPGATYVFSSSVYTDHRGGRSSDVKTRLLAAPAGGTELRDYEHITTSQWYATEGTWVRGSVQFTAKADTVTVGFDLEQRWSLERSSLYVDGARLERLADEEARP